MAVMDDITKAVTMDLKKKGNLIYCVGLTRDELGGSHYYYVNGETGRNVPKVYAEYGKKVMDKLSAASAKGLVVSCHDCSEGGIGVAVAEMAFSGELGADIDLRRAPNDIKDKRSDKLLFSESNTRFIVEVAKKDKMKFEKALNGAPFGMLGKVAAGKRLRVKGIDGKIIVDEEIMGLKKAWQGTFKKI